MSESVTPATNPYAVPLADLERETRVPLEDQTVAGQDDAAGTADWAWDEERRQTQLAGGA